MKNLLETADGRRILHNLRSRLMDGSILLVVATMLILLAYSTSGS